MNVVPNHSLPSRFREDRVHNVIDLTSDSDTDYGSDIDLNEELLAAQLLPRPAGRTQYQRPPPKHIEIIDSPTPTPPSSPEHVQHAQVAIHQNNADDEMNDDNRAAEPDSVANLPLHPNPGRRVMENPAIGDYVLDDDWNDNVMAQFLGPEAGQVEPLVPIQDAALPLQESAQPLPQEPPLVEPMDECISNVALIFPGICLDFVSSLYGTKASSSNHLIAYILDKLEKGTPWPTAKDSQKAKKRKRDLDEDEQAALQYGAVDRVLGSPGPLTKGIRGFIRDILREEFPETPMNFIDATLSQLGFRLFSAYRVLEEAQRTYDPVQPPYNKVKRRNMIEFQDQKIPILLGSAHMPHDRIEVLEELVAARKIRAKADQKRETARQAEVEEEANLIQAQEEGSMKECGCCCGDYPLNRMVHCNGEDEHWFCRKCALTNAETQIGASRYELFCMSMDGCTAGFAMDQRSQFLDENTTIALERNEQEAVLRMAGIENLASCPFCPYAAEYPPIEINKEFECRRSDCEKISCRLCNQESHIPKSCEEHAKETGLSIRREVEEAMTAALIRKCNKCQTPFIKEEGCNKMTCTRNGCHNIQCYVCSKSCGYDHFNDRSRGGKEGNCPLFENAEERHDQEVREAERLALAKVRAEHPEYTEDDLRVTVSEEVKMDDERRKASHPRARIAAQGNLAHNPQFIAHMEERRRHFSQRAQDLVFMGHPFFPPHPPNAALPHPLVAENPAAQFANPAYAMQGQIAAQLPQYMPAMNLRFPDVGLPPNEHRPEGDNGLVQGVQMADRVRQEWDRQLFYRRARNIEAQNQDPVVQPQVPGAPRMEPVARMPGINNARHQRLPQALDIMALPPPYDFANNQRAGLGAQLHGLEEQAIANAQRRAFFRDHPGAQGRRV